MTAEEVGMRSEDDRETTVRVTILGQEYPLRAHADADYVREIAASLDARMRKIQQAEPDRPPLKVAILTALNLIDEVFALRREKVDLADRFERKVREYTELLSRGLME